MSTDGTMLFEAPHGTAHDLYLRYLETDGKEANFNSSALIFAVANALEEMARREDNAPLLGYAGGLKSALIETVAQGTITGDLKGKTLDPEKETVVDMAGFLDAVEANLPA
jgi:isocitrate dehydrogenase